MPNKWTFKIPPIAELLTRTCGNGRGWADPFAGKSTFAEFRNDLNPAHEQPSQKEAADFLAQFTDASLKGVIFDPPYSPTQVRRAYDEMGYRFKGKDDPTGGFRRVRDHIARILPAGAICVSFGWNTVGMGIKRGFAINEILIVSHGGNRNDTLCTVEHRSLPKWLTATNASNR
jgi:hypothetical protein